MKYRILLLSDIHWLAVADEFDPHFELRKCFLSDIKDCVDTTGAIDAILICGDIAGKGAKEEYDNAQLFLNKVCENSRCEKEQIYCVPGNHDKDFGAPYEHLRHVLHLGLSQETPHSHERFKDLLDKDFNTVKVLYAPFKNYHDFAFAYDSAEPLMTSCLDGSTTRYNKDTDSTYLKKYLTTLDGFEVFLYGLNSSVISDWYDIDDYDPKRSDGHNLFIPNVQFCVETENRINIAIMHHPLNFVSNGAKIGEQFDKKFHIQVFGHIHKPSSNKTTSVHVYSGAFQPPSQSGLDGNQFFSVFNILELEVIKNPSPSLKVSLRVEKYCTDKGFENYKPETKEYYVPLKDGHPNRWEESQTILDKKQMDIPSRKIVVKFLQSRNPKQYIKRLGVYDESLSLPLNCKLFLQNLEAEGKLIDLWNLLEK